MDIRITLPLYFLNYTSNKYIDYVYLVPTLLNTF